MKFFKIFKLLFPFSNAFSLFINKRLSQFIKGLSALPQDLKEYIQNIYLDLFPDTTRLLDKWNETFGIGFPAKIEDDQRMDLDTTWKAQGGQGFEYIQNVLNNAGFDVQVHENNPPVDPDLFLNSIPIMVANGPAAFAGNDQAFAGKTGGDLLVNGPIVTNTPIYESICGGANIVCGNDRAVCGQFDKFGTEDKIYQITDDPDLWGAFFFIGGDATRNAITHELETIENIDIPIERKPEFIRLILKLKPVQTWAGLMIDYV
jgi:hypothetical protein